MVAPLMHLKILLPFQVFRSVEAVASVVVETAVGSFGFLAHRLDCVAAILPGILTYHEADREHYVAVDRGVLAKNGLELLVSVRRATAGADLGALRSMVEQEFLALDESEQIVRTAMAKLESGFLRRFTRLQHE